MAEEWLDAANSVDQDTVETSGPEYPFIQWVNGKPNMKKSGGMAYQGGWFMPSTQLSIDCPEGWAAEELVHDSGSSTAGYYKRDIAVAVIRVRRRWIIYDKTTTSWPWSQYQEAAKATTEGRPSGHLQALSVVKGLESLGPVVLTMKGSISRAFMGSRGDEGVLGRFNRMVIREANSINARRGVLAKFPYRAFWLAVGPQRDGKDQPVFTEVGQKPNSSMVTLPAPLGLDAQLQNGDLAKRFVGRELLEQLNAYYVEADAWATAWNQVQVAESEFSPAAPEEPPFDDENLPF